MSNQNIMFKLNKLDNDMAALYAKVDQQSAVLKDLIKLMAPSFPTVEANDISNDLIEASTQGIVFKFNLISLSDQYHIFILKAREEGMANALNPDLLGKRDIPKVLKEVSDAFVPTNKTAYPGPQLRLLGLINHFKKEKGITGLLIDDVSNFNDYNILKTVARRIHDEMVDEVFKDLRKENKPVFLPLWSKVSSEIVARYSFKLEKTASQHGFYLSRCQHSWASLLLLSETHKHRSNRSRGKAAVYDLPSTLDFSSYYG